MRSAPAYPKDTTLPFPLSEDSTHLLFRFCELQVYINNGILGYVFQLPLVSRGTVDIYIYIYIYLRNRSTLDIGVLGYIGIL
jgi:hypothetical protein